MTSEDTFSIWWSHLIYWFLIHYLFLCIYFFIVIWESPSYGIILFFQSVIYILGAWIAWLSFYCFWRTILTLHKSTHIEDTHISHLVSLGIGFIVTMTLVFLSALVGQYNLYSVGLIFVVIIWVSLPIWKDTFISYIHNKKYYQRESGWILWNTSLLIDEVLFILISFLLSVNLISVFRPFPIGWDDLWAYMNIPKLLSWAWETIAFWKMYVWELYTGIGFLFWSQTFAFYLNSFSWIIAAIVIYIAINSFTKHTKQKYDLWLLSAVIFLMMPMVIFQLAKDMKIDIGLFSISIIAISLFYHLLFSQQKKNSILYIILWILIGTAFAIKVTSLLLLLWVIASLFFIRLWFAWFFSFIFLFVWSFSVANLWKMINVYIPSGIENIQLFWFIFFVIWILILSAWFFYNFKKQTVSFTWFFLPLSSIILWFFIALSPWIVKQIWEIPNDHNPWIATLISWVSDRYVADYLEIYSQEELDTIQKDINNKMSSSGTTTNEDFGRYFWYEQWINNFLKLPWNLTHQINQKGEFTDITFLFLALIPWIFLFLPYRKEAYKYPVIGAMFIAYLYFLPISPLSGIITQLFWNIHLPIWYIIIAWLFILPLVYLSWALDKKDKITSIFLTNLAFLTVYMWIWAISSYGVVWYGIVMYFILLLCICLCIIWTWKDKDIHNYLSYLVLIFVAIYAFQSSIPHGITNLKAASYKEYKIGNLNEEVSVMSYHPEYFPIMFELNISDAKKQELFIEYRKDILIALSSTKDFSQILPQIQAYTSMDELHRLIVELSKLDLPEPWVNQQIKDIRHSLYDLVIYTPDEYKNTENIYRVGTFMKYFISENNTRLFEDSLINHFDNYIYDENIDIIYERFQKLDISYILIDLNAATIDRDPEKRLTQRYEHLLNFVKDSRIELIETDSICLRLAHDNYKKTGDTDGYMALAWINYNSKLTQAQKRQICFNAMSQIISNESLLAQYPYLAWYKKALVTAGIDITNSGATIVWISQLLRGNWFKALFKIN